MKKLLVVFFASAMIFGLMSCGSTKVEETKTTKAAAPVSSGEFVASGESVDEICKTLSESLGVGVKFVVDQDISKKTPLAVSGAKATVGTYLGKKCVQVTRNDKNEIRFAFVFDKPVPCENLDLLQFFVMGFESWGGVYNCGLMYEAMNGAEHKLSCYSSETLVDEWTEVAADFVFDELWGTNFSREAEAIAIQFWCGDEGPIYISDLKVSKF